MGWFSSNKGEKKRVSLVNWVALTDLLNFRPISNQLAETFNIHHQSPQILIIKNGKCDYSATHDDIATRSIKKNL